MNKSYIFAAGLSCMSVLAFAQEKKETSAMVQERIVNQMGQPAWITLKSGMNLSVKQSPQVLQQFLKTTENENFQKIKSESDNLGFVHDTYQQYYNDVKVEFGIYKVHSKHGDIQFMNGDYYPVKNMNTSPVLSAEVGLQQAINHIGADNYMWEYEKASKEMDNYERPTGELVILPAQMINKEQNRLAYKYDIYATHPISRGYVYVDAQNGEILFYDAIIKHINSFGHIDEHSKKADYKVAFGLVEASQKVAAPMMASGTAATRYSGTQMIATEYSGGKYILADNTKKIYTRNANNQSTSGYPYVGNYTQFTDSDNNWTAAEFNNSAKDDAALDAHFGATKTYDYFLERHNRNSYDNNGAQIRSYVHVGSNYDNAFWNGSVMSYGDGSSNGSEGNGYFDALTSLDVAAHEIGHAICSSTANLAYQKESGAMNEGFSDIWAAVIEHYATPNDQSKDPWLIGEEIDRRNGSIALRSMSNPKDRSQPDTYGGTYWINPNCYPTSNNDYCGVHTNSGVLNHWFYILSEGKSGTNDIGDSFTVSGIGMDKAAQIAYRLEAVYLSSSSTFANARTYGIQAATDLFGADSAEVIATTNAWYAVGVGEAHTGGGENPPASDCYADDVILTITFDNYPQETSWTLKDANGVTVDSQQYSTSNPDGSTVTKTFSGLEAGNYTFIIKDAYGDGICCSYGSGSYALKSGSSTFKSGGSFGSSESTTFCIEASAGDSQAPTAPTALVYNNVTTTSVQLSWTASTDNVGVVGYQVFSGSNNIGTVSGPSANITGLTPTTTYTFRVKAIDEAGNVSSSSNTVTFTTLSESSNPNCVNDDLVLTITTDRYPRETSWALKNASGTVVASRTAGYYRTGNRTYSHTIGGLAAGDYTFTIYDSYGDGICCSYGNGSYVLKSGNITIKSGGAFGSSEATGFCANTTGNVSNYLVNEDSFTFEKDYFHISPNPASEFTKFILEDAKDGAKYKIFDQVGNLVLQGELSNKKVDVKSLSTGLYIVKVYHGNEVYTEKLIKK